MFFRRRSRDTFFKRLFIIVTVVGVFAWIHNRTTKIQIIEVDPEFSQQLVEELDDPFSIENNHRQNLSHEIAVAQPDAIVTKENLRNDTTKNEDIVTVNERMKAETENTDEFLESLLSNFEYSEADLRTKRIAGKDYAEDDKDIQEYLSKIVPGLGDGGLEAKMPETMAAQAQEIRKKEAFNRLLSNMITPNRAVPDLRDNRCKSVQHDRNLPDATVIIIYNDEALSTLLRTIHSIVNRSPPHLLKEIILVDDFSDSKDLKGGLERYLATRFPPKKVRLVRLNKRAGLVRAKMIGAHLATGQVIVFFDSHCETGHVWLEPLLKRIKEDRTAVVTPIIDYIDTENLLYADAGNREDIMIGGFGWSLHFTWIKTPEGDFKREGFPHTPIKSPAMIGGLFAINRKYFWEIGSYDSGMGLWGGENLEISFRIWQCGGSIEIMPCSRIGHMYRATHPHITGKDESHGLNSARLAEVWMDEYKELYYSYNKKNGNYGDISRRLALRDRLKCKNFKWYLDNVYKDKFQMTKASSHAGPVENKAMNYCLDNMAGSDFEGNYTLAVYKCHNDSKTIWDAQIFFLSHSGQLRREFACATVAQSNTRVNMTKCDKLLPEEKWTYDGVILKHSPSEKCIAVVLSSGKAELIAQECVPALPSQQWIFDKTFNP